MRKSFWEGIGILLLGMALGLVANSFRAQTLPLGEPLPELRRGEISLEGALQKMQRGEAVFLDARSARSFKKGHLKGAISLPIHSFESRYRELAADLQGKTLITYCTSPYCSLSRRLATLLRDKGHDEVWDMKAGYNRWKKRGYPVE